MVAERALLLVDLKDYQKVAGKVAWKAD